MKHTLFFIVIGLCICVASCQKDLITESPDARIAFSTDTLFFDTVFTSVGSVTHSFKIINLNNQKLRLTSVRLAGGSASPFKININGVPATEITNETLNANDSMYVFVQVLVNPDDNTQPFIIRDSIEVSFNGNRQWVQLQAHGQNAIFLKNKIIDSDTAWNEALPIVITGSLKVSPGRTLTIREGSRIYLHATAPFIVNGTLVVDGSPQKPVIFSGDRRDADYKDLPAAWPGIFFSATSRNNVLKSAIIQNAYQGIVVEQMADNGLPKLQMTQSVVRNIYDAGVLAINSSIVADNSLIANCGSNIVLAAGGEYAFVNCTVATFGSYYITHKNPVLQVSDFIEQANNLFTTELQAEFVNSIFWGDNGSVDNEILLVKKGSKFGAVFENCIYKAKEEIQNGFFKNSFLNTPPLFDSINTLKNIYDFHFNEHPESPAIGNGKSVPYSVDLDGVLRSNPPDIGCYQRR